MPADIPLVVLVSTKAADWQTLGRFQLFQSAYAGLKALVPPSVQLDYTNNVDSWLGDEVALVLLPQVGKAATINSSFLALAPVRNGTRLQQLLAQLQPGKQQSLTELQYKGVTILDLKTLAPTLSPQNPKQPTSVQPSLLQQFNVSNLAITSPPPSQPNPRANQLNQETAIALLPTGYVIAASSVKPIEQFLDLPKGGNTLAQNPQFQRAIQRPRIGPKLITFYEDPSKFFLLFNSLAKDPSLPFSIPLNASIRSEQLKQFSAICGFLLVQSEGLRLQINTYFRTPTTYRDNIPSFEVNQVLERIPATSYSAANGRNLKRKWQTLLLAFGSDPQLNSGLNQFRNFIRSMIGLDFDQDIISWMDGDYASFFYPTKKGIASLISPEFNAGMGFLVQTSNRIAAEIALKRLNQFVNSYSNGSITVANRDIQGKPVTSWEMKTGNAANSLFAYSWVDGNTLLMTTGLGAMTDLVPLPYESLPKAFTFTTATHSLPSPNEGYFYLNMGAFLSWAYGFVPPAQSRDPYFHIFQQLIGSIRSISATSFVTAEQEQLDGLVVLAPAKK